MISKKDSKTMQNNKILIENCKNGINYFIKTIKKNKISSMPIENIYKFWLLTELLHDNISEEEYKKFIGNLFGIETKNSVEQAEEIIAKLYKKRGQNNGN